MEDAHTFDAEDVPVLFELMRVGALPVDEPPALRPHRDRRSSAARADGSSRPIGDALAPNGTVTLAGDHRQVTDETAYFAGWPAARGELRVQRWAEVTLAVTYRSVPAIGDFARELAIGNAQLPADPPHDPAVWATACPGALAQAAQLCWQLAALGDRDPWRQIAVIARNPDHARRLHAELTAGSRPALVLDGDFRFEPGVIVTTRPRSPASSSMSS